MKKVKKITLKPKLSLFLKILGLILCLLLGGFLFYRKQINDIKKVGYSELASKNILFASKKSYILSIGENETLNKVFEEKTYKEEYLDSYRKINYVSQEHFIENVNKLLDIGYSVGDINIIFAHGNDKAVSRFVKREKVRYLEEFFTIKYAKLDNYDRYVAYSDATGEDEATTVLYVNLDLDKEDYTEATLVKEFSMDMLINKHRYLEEDFIPKDLVEIDKSLASEEGMKANHVALNAYQKMQEAAVKEGYSIVINSAYRSYQDQIDISNSYLRAYGQNYVDKYVAKPGFSEHQTGLAFDIGSRKVNVFENSKEYGWMQENAHKYGFIRRFSKQKEGITGFRNEPWHYRYVGVEIATYIYENNMSLEEYFVNFLDTNE